MRTVIDNQLPPAVAPLPLSGRATGPGADTAPGAIPGAVPDTAGPERVLLLTPGPLTTSDRTRAALNHDWGSRDARFIALTSRLRERLAAVAGGTGTHETVLLPGSGTFAVEAAIQSLVPRDGRALVLANGAYGRRMAEMLRRLGRAHDTMQWAEHEPVDPAALDRRLAAEPAVTDVLVVQCETTSGILNPVDEVASAVRRHGRRLMVDAMSAIGALPVAAARWNASAVMASSNKGLEGVPGIGFVVAERAHLAASAGVAASLSLDLHAQWDGFRRDGQWRFTPPVQVAAALDAALDQLDEEGGVPARHARYARNCRVLVDGMRALGFQTLLPDALQAPVIVTFRDPGPPFSFERFYDALQAQGIVIYPGKLTREPSFRIGCIGAIGAADLARAVRVAGDTLRR
ncbi:2-aminoethylphosphonate--pyruvate transaminase [Rhizosaccharibacter radicis]|uniref:2-aminoethylphosphonate--pyruvate transaminase n=1 Tax=Rhizosaccharibacter radicis TaxID=2782605 RepID=A0ABT1W0H6_9PROT|nr:2-aminoethylphosphonate--pyruvate transaminase [Acetobacteraceae bacterium KSS12]